MRQCLNARGNYEIGTHEWSMKKAEMVCKHTTFERGRENDEWGNCLRKFLNKKEFLRHFVRTGAKQKFVSNLILKIFSTMWQREFA